MTPPDNDGLGEVVSVVVGYREMVSFTVPELVLNEASPCVCGFNGMSLGC